VKNPEYQFVIYGILVFWYSGLTGLKNAVLVVGSGVLGQETQNTSLGVGGILGGRGEERDCGTGVWVIGAWDLRSVWNLLLGIWDFRPVAVGSCRRGAARL
jgi:hypothetical protein